MTLLAKLLYVPATLLATLLLGGCCCPALSGRYCEVGMSPPPCKHGALDASGGGCDPALHHPGLAHRPHLFAKAPSEQHADYISPLPRFHPVPTRPVFAPVTPSHQPQLLDPLPKPLGIAAGHQNH